MAKAYIEPDEVTKMEGVVGNLRDRLLVRLTFWASCRISESLGIRIPQDIDFEKALITIQHLKVRVSCSCPSCGARLSKKATFCPGCGKKVTETVQKAKNNNKRRQVPIDRQTMDLLREYIERDHTKGLLFKIGRIQAYNIVRNASLKAGLGKLLNPESGKEHYVSPHKLRDAFATMAVKEDDSMDAIRALQEQLGHSSINTTMKYRKVAGGELRKWHDKISKSRPKQLAFTER